MSRIQEDVEARRGGVSSARREARAREEADKKARNIVGIAIQRVAADHTAESTVSVVHIPSDDMKGRIIGREGRNIRAFEQLTGINLIIDDTPEAVILSSFDPVRREIGRITLETLIADGRIHPARIEEMFKKAEPARRAADPRGGRAGRVRRRRPRPAPRDRPHARPAQVPHELRPERAQPLARGRVPRRRHGRRARRSTRKLAKRAGLLHDLGKAIDHEVEGPHAVIGADLARRIERAQGDRALHRGAPRRRRAADRRGRARPGRRRDLGGPPGRPPRDARELHQAPREARGARRGPQGRREVLRHAGRPRDPRHGQAGADQRRRRGRAWRATSPSRSKTSSSIPARSRSWSSARAAPSTTPSRHGARTPGDDPGVRIPPPSRSAR